MVREGRVFKSQTGSGRPEYGVGFYVTAYEVGAEVAIGSVDTQIEVRANHGFQAGDSFIVGLDPGRFERVAGVSDTTLFLFNVMPVAAGELLINLGQDTGDVAPEYNSNSVPIYADMGYSNLLNNSTVFSDNVGRYRYYHQAGLEIWELVRTPAGVPFALYTDTDSDVESSGLFNVKDYGAVGDGSTDDYTAINLALLAAGVTGGMVHFPYSSGGYRIGSDIAFPYTIGVKIDMKAALTPDAGVTVRLQGPVEAGMYTIIAGDGSVLFTSTGGTDVLYGPVTLPEAPIQWWGCVPNITPDCGPTIEVAMNSTAAGTFLTFHGGTFRIATPVAVTKRYFNIRGETGGYHPGAGYPTFIWTGVTGGIMFTFTSPFGIKMEMCAFDGDFSAATVMWVRGEVPLTEGGSGLVGTSAWNCHWDRCTFTACIGDSFIMGGSHNTYADDFLQALFTHCWFDRPSGRTSDADGNALDISTIPSSRHFLLRAWNSWNVRFDACHFFNIGDSSDADDTDRVGVYAQGGELVFADCFFYGRGTDIYLAPPGNSPVASYLRVYGGESQSEEFIRFPAMVGVTPTRSYLIQGVRHIQSFQSNPALPNYYIPDGVTSIYWDGPASSNQYVLVLDSCTFNEDVYIGANPTTVIDNACRFSNLHDFVGYPEKIFGILGTKGTNTHQAYGHGLRIGANIMRFGPTATTGYLRQHDVKLNNETSDTVLALDFIQKWVQSDGSADTNLTGAMTTFFGSPNYQGDSQTKVNGAIQFDPAWAGGTLTLTTKVRPQGRAIYELLWRCDSGDTAGEHDYCAGTGHIYVMRDKVGGNDDLWRISYRENTQYDNQGEGTGKTLTITAFFWDGATPTTEIADGTTINIPAPYVIRLTVATMDEDRHTTFYGAIRRIL